MAESITIGYARLFEIRLLHHYWLDEGTTVFDAMPEEKRNECLLSYDMRSFLELTPAASTEKALKGLGCVFKNTALGCIVAVPKETVIPADANFEFIVTIQDSAFYNYTALTLRSQKIFESYYQPEKKTYRYKENVPVLSNLTGVSRPNLGNALFLSSEIPALAADDQVESLVLSGNALLQLTGDQPGADTQQLSAQATDLPVFVHQGDVPAIVPPPGLSGAPARGVMLSGDIPDNVFAVIRLSATRGDNPAFSFIDSNGNAKDIPVVFEVRFKNRSTTWKYFKKQTGAPDSVESKPLPLTRYGNAGTKQKPSEGLVKAEKSGDKITRLVSEVYV